VYFCYRKRRRITEIVSGVIRWQRRLHWTLSNLPKPTKIDKMDPPLRILLYMATYELLELKLASHAINEYVTLARDVMHDGCAKVANGVLRSVIRLKDSGTLPVPPKPEKGMKFNDVANLLAINFSHPTWMVGRWLKQFGLQRTVELLKVNNSRPKYSVRITPGQDIEDLIMRLEDMGVVLNRSNYLPEEYLVVSSGLQSIINSGLLKEGKLQVQDEAAGMVVAMLSPQGGENILDCCAAPGGKTLFAAARMSGKGTIVALDSVDSRLGALRKASQHQGFGDMITCIAADARQFCENAAQSNDTFDRVLVDAPCSGTGVLCKRADMRWRRKISDMAGLVTLQNELLDAASMVVCPGGLLVYSTCSIEPEENELVVESFIEKHPEFYLEPADVVPDIPKECMNASGMLQMYPDVHRTDGAFAARLRKGSLRT
jgi:16S rRNA (cytosine967-C5)-methyltransferase